MVVVAVAFLLLGLVSVVGAPRLATVNPPGRRRSTSNDPAAIRRVVLLHRAMGVVWLAVAVVVFTLR